MWKRVCVELRVGGGFEVEADKFVLGLGGDSCAQTNLTERKNYEVESCDTSPKCTWW